MLSALLCALALPALAASPVLPEARQAELIHRLKHDCGSCHGMTMKGGLGPPCCPAIWRKSRMTTWFR